LIRGRKTRNSRPGVDGLPRYNSRQPISDNLLGEQRWAADDWFSLKIVFRRKGDVMRPCLALNGTENPTLTPKQEAAALSIASGQTILEASRHSGAGERTIKTWSATDARFSERVSELRARMTEQALGRLTEGMTKAAITLQRLLDAKGENIRLGAARTILELALRLQENSDFQRRIAALEATPNHSRNVA
jgi:hypothetical protein